MGNFSTLNMTLIGRTLKAFFYSSFWILTASLLWGQGCPVSCPQTCNESSNPSENYYIDGPVDLCQYPPTGCASSLAYVWENCCRKDISPILIDIGAGGFNMTSLQNGVRFKITPDIPQEYQMSWTAGIAQNAWLVLDWNENGRIDNLTELFGNLTPQDGPFAQRNGFKALALYDAPNQGGNNDGLISPLDLVFSKLRLWLDSNHDGVSQPQEMSTLQSHGIESMDLDFKDSKRVDEFGNQFRFRARIGRAPGSRVNPWAFDVYLLIRRVD